MIEASEVREFCRQYFQSDPVAVLFKGGHLSTVLGLRLQDDRELVVKARPDAPRLVACHEIQSLLWERGFPCPEPLTPPVPVKDGIAVSAEAFIRGGMQLEPGPDSPRLFAASLARLVELAGEADGALDFEPTPPWAFGHHHLPDLWPAPDDSAVNLNEHPGPVWMDEAALRARAKLLSCEGTSVIGHVDWELQNILWVNRKLHVVHDWDSLAAMPEPMIAGVASAVFTATGAPDSSSTIDEAAGFLENYQEARDRRWTPFGLEVAWAAGLWVRLFNAKKAVVRDPDTPSVRALDSEISLRLALAGA